MNRKKTLIFALLLPIVSLLILTGYKRHVLVSGREITLPISGYDPRDLLSGHYLTYRIDYGVADVCQNNSKRSQGFVCLDPKGFSKEKLKSCHLYIAGTCDWNRFEAGIEKFFIPEEVALQLEKEIRLKRATIVLSIPPNGHAQVKDLLLDGISWKESLRFDPEEPPGDASETDDDIDETD